MSWYRAGTIALTNGSATVTGSGTAFIANAQIGEGLVAPDGRIYEITAIASDTSLTISPAYLGSTASAQAYAIAPVRGRIAQLLSETSSLLSSFATVRDGIGAGLFPNGTVSLPALRASADQDTGLFFPSANVLGIVTGGVRRVAIDGNGNVGIGIINPLAPLTVQASSGTGAVRLVGRSSDGVSTLDFTSADQSTTQAFIQSSGNNLIFGSGNGEDARIDGNGNLLVGTTSSEGPGRFCSVSPTSGTACGSFRNAAGAGATIQFFINAAGNSIIGSITNNGDTGVLYNTSSDARLKHDIEDAPEAGEIIDTVKVRSFKWNADNREQRFGMVAQELFEVVPEAVYVPADEEQMMAVDYSKLVPLLVREVQSLRARVAQLEAGL